MKFTIWHGIATSLALHSALALPFVVDSLIPPPDEPPLLVLDLQGVVADEQIEKKVVQQTKGAEQQEKEPVAKPEQAAAPPPPPDDPPKHVAEEGDTPVPPPASPAQVQSPPATATQSGSANNIKGAEQQQDAQRIKDLETEKDRINAYVALLGKKVRANMVYPDDGRSAAAVVAFTVLGSGQLRPGSLRIAESSGQAALDASALKTIRASAPFDPPPHELNLAVTVDFARKH